LDYDYILTKLDDIGMGGILIDSLMMLDGSEFIGAGMYLEEPYDPSSTFRGFSGDSIGKGEIKGIYARR
jgi:hypothetical protein